MLCGIDTKDAAIVRQEWIAVFKSLFPAAELTTTLRLFSQVEACFLRGFADYLPIDAPYHDFEHTLQGTLCLARLLAGRQSKRITPPLTPRLMECGLAAILLHDTGYLKRSHDRTGTGAKYTAEHVQRSVDFVPPFLKSEGMTEAEIGSIQQMIWCTGLGVRVDTLPFATEIERQLGWLVATADLLGQMAADDYVDKLPLLFQEFSEASRHPTKGATPLARFASVEELIQRTPAFWQSYVMPKLEKDLNGVYRYLEAARDGGANPFLQAVERNLARIQEVQAARRP